MVMDVPARGSCDMGGERVGCGKARNADGLALAYFEGKLWNGEDISVCIKGDSW
jgi:hypothetical protein